MNNNDYEIYVENLNRPLRLDSLNKLSKEVFYINSQWIKAINSINFKIDEGDLRAREIDVYSALLKLESTDEWKKENEDIFAEFICLADTINVVDKVKLIFNFTSNSPAVKRVSEKLLQKYF